MASRTKKPAAPRTEDVANMTPEQLLEIEDRHKREYPRLGWYEPEQAHSDVHRLVGVIRRLTGWQRPDPTLFEKRLGRIARVAGVTRRKSP